jgi:hypothetical protein
LVSPTADPLTVRFQPYRTAARVTLDGEANQLTTNFLQALIRIVSYDDIVPLVPLLDTTNDSFQEVGKPQAVLVVSHPASKNARSVMIRTHGRASSHPRKSEIIVLEV